LLMNEAALFPFKITSLASCFLSAVCVAWLVWRVHLQAMPVLLIRWDMMRCTDGSAQ
jgi:hypothetical protein